MKNNYTKSDIETILKENDFEYHRVDLPYGLHTPGEDRGATRDIIFPEELDGASVLDVGSANGYFCFEAEKKGAGRVVGVELKESRYRHANILKSILSSQAEFLNVDILSQPLEETFDYVLLLNVIHHLPDPVHVLRYLASITKRKFIVEFPTFSDPKYRKFSGISFPFIYNRLPLIGVSSTADDKIDQTFVFSAGALKNILMNHQVLFSDMKLLNSPMGVGRRIAIFEK